MILLRLAATPITKETFTNPVAFTGLRRVNKEQLGSFIADPKSLFPECKISRRELKDQMLMRIEGRITPEVRIKLEYLYYQMPNDSIALILLNPADGYPHVEESAVKSANDNFNFTFPPNAELMITGLTFDLLLNERASSDNDVVRGNISVGILP